MFSLDQDQEKFFETLILNIRSRLPIQNPLSTFVHNNILQMFEDKDFHDALSDAGNLYRARSYWPVERYIEKHSLGKITEIDIERSIDHYLGQYKPIPSIMKLGLTDHEYFYRLMFSDLGGTDDESSPEISNSVLWDFCLNKMANKSLVLSSSKISWRGKNYWEKYHAESFILNAHPLLIRLISSYLDQGQSIWANPFVKQGFLTFFIFDILSQKGFTTNWKTTLIKRVKRYEHSSAKEIIFQELTDKKIPREYWQEYLLEILFDLKGWAGMVNKLEIEPWQATVKAPKISLVDYIAATLLIESSIDNYHSEAQSIDLALIHGREEKVEIKNFELALRLYQIAVSFKLSVSTLEKISDEDLLQVIDEIHISDNRDSVRLWHESFEHHFHREAIESLAAHTSIDLDQVSPYAQMLFCIDDREESMRRHLEELDSGIKTYGVVGFFGIDMNFSSFKNQRLIAQCPPVILPSRIIKEVPKVNATKYHLWNLKRGAKDLSLYYSSRTLVRGFITTIILGFMSILVMFFQIFFPNKSKVLFKRVLDFFGREPETRLVINNERDGHGYSKVEMAKIVQMIIQMCGMQNNMSDLVVLIGHGSTSNNNPFKQAYGCGACGGNAGIPNSRTFAEMANDTEVRLILVQMNMSIPDSTFFVSAYHDTCTDEIIFFNREQLPDSHLSKFEMMAKSLNKAAKLNAFERCQRFSSFEADLTPDDALKHVKERSNDLAQPRPEYGHSSNALAVVGKRELTRGLFMNRRSFLLSYDWEHDLDGSILKKVVLGGVPVCVNINMDYYFSCVDNDNFGCGSKLPLNLTSLLGVMTGSQGDLRIGLARQMVEIHEPIRNMTLIEAPLERVEILFNSHPRLKNILYHHWFRLTVKDPITKKWWIFTNNKFEELQFDKRLMKHYPNSMVLIRNSQPDEDFAEVSV